MTDFITPSKSDNIDVLRKRLMQKKSQISTLEHQNLKYDEAKTHLTRLFQDFQRNHGFRFIDPELLSSPFSTSQEAITILRKGISDFVLRHEKLANKFEIEFSRTIFELQQKLQSKKDECDKSMAELADAQESLMHLQQVVKLLRRKKRVLCHTVLLRRQALESSTNKREKEATDIQNQLENCKQKIQHFQENVKQQDEAAKELTTLAEDIKVQEETRTKTHFELVETVENLRKQFQRESHSHNCDLAALDVAKSDLRALQMKIDSYFDNLKTKELLDAEIENRKLQAVIKNERDQLSRQKAVIDSKGNDIQNTISQYIEKISNLNDQISQTEQKLQAQMMRIPDFPQLHQALDRTLAQTKKYQEELMQKKYLLDEIGDRNRLLDQMEIQESKNRMAQLKILMPFRDQENNDDIMKQLPEMLAERAKQQKEFEELIHSPGF